MGNGTASIPVVLMRGGTSKGVFLREEHLPAAGPDRDELLLDLMGSPDPMQLDGLGGSHANTSKVIIVRGAGTPDVDVEYTAVQIGTSQPIVDASANCGNLTTAVGPYCVDEGLVRAEEPITTIRMLNRNSGRVVVARVPVKGGRADTRGECRVDGVPGLGAAITNEYLDPQGGLTGRLLPTGDPRQVIDSSRGAFEVSIVDVTHPMVFIKAASLGVPPDVAPVVVNSDAELLDVLEAIRGSCAKLLNRVGDARTASDLSPTVPRLALVGSPSAADDSVHIVARMLAMGRMLPAFAMTGAICTAAACVVPGTLPFEVARPPVTSEIRIGHPEGAASVWISTSHVAGDRESVKVCSATVIRSARRLLAGIAELKGSKVNAVNPTSAVLAHQAVGG